MGLREGDIESLRNRAALDGRPIKSQIVTDKQGNQIHYEVRGKDKRVTITDVIKTK